MPRSVELSVEIGTSCQLFWPGVGDLDTAAYVVTNGFHDRLPTFEDLS